ncbi:hypothetical protein [Paraburkholderia sp. BR10882]|uniref:hypothetical protein n=1 Tax=unclassified Paraburkholderia TaxID=2615204 RepID=UPI0034CD88B8
MKHSVEAKKIVGLLQSRRCRLNIAMQRQRDALADIDSKLVNVRDQISRLRQDISKHAGSVRYDRGGLMRARGKQAVIKFEIACSMLQEASLIEHRERIDQHLRASMQAVVMLEQRKCKHSEWIQRKRLQEDLRLQSAVDAELQEGRHRANQFYK